MKPLKVLAMVTCLTALGVWPYSAGAVDRSKASEHVLLRLLGEELDYSMKNLAMPDGTKPYFLAYTITDQENISIRTQLGNLMDDTVKRRRVLDVDVRVGDYKLDNTHKLREGWESASDTKRWR